LKRILITPILWGFFLSAVASAAAPLPSLKSTLPRRLDDSRLSPAPDGEVHARILAIRVDFVPDTLSTTTGTGAFGSGLPADAVVDPLPHDRAYFEAHLAFLDNYFTEVSGGRATVEEFAVYPLESEAAYRMPHQMWHYNYNATPEELDRQLSELFVDAWTAAAQDPAIDFSQWDTFIIYHAGVGQDFEVGFSETPHDIPSAFFTLDDLRESLGDPDFNGVLVDTAAGIYLHRGLLLPESERQSEVDVEIAMNGTEALLFAHSLGLPALYDTEDGSSGVGRFDLMDQGSGNFAGMVPALPGAWSRAFMGWADPRLIEPGAQADTFWVTMPGVSPAADTLHEIYRLNLDQSEYYLIENRSWDPDSLGYTIAWDAQGRRLKIHENYDLEVLDGDFGVITRVDNWDFGLPGEGILIWHVDENAIAQGYATNRVNTDPGRLGVTVVEADGAPDIGQGYGFLDIGYGTDLGWAGDFFFSGNSQFLAANPQIRSVIFYDDSHPGTRTRDGSSTGLRLAAFSLPDTVMRFSVQNQWAQTGFPRQTAGGTASLSPSAVDFDADGRTDWILTVTPGGAVQAFDSLGRAQGEVLETRWTVNLLGDSSQVTDTLLARLDSIILTPALTENPGGLTAVIPAAGGKVYLLHVGFLDSVNFTVILDSVALPAEASCLPMIPGMEEGWWYIGDAAGRIFIYDLEGDSVFAYAGLLNAPVAGFCRLDSAEATSRQFFAVSHSGEAVLVDLLSGAQPPAWKTQLPFTVSLPPVALEHAADLPADRRRDLAVVGNGGEVALLDPADGSLRPGFPFQTGMAVTAPPAAADFDRDGRLELILAGDNRILGVASNGVLAANWPLVMDAHYPLESILSPPAVTELANELRVVFGWPGGSVDARNREGEAPNGFTLSTGTTVKAAPLLLQLDGDEESELLALDKSGGLYCWHLEQLGGFDGQLRPWNGLQNGNARTGLALGAADLAPAGPELLVTAKVYPWPNPAGEVSHIRYRMEESGTVTVRIFDGAGDLVKELSGPAQAGLEGELVWDLADVTSGVYLGRVEAQAGGRTETTFIKIAVVK